MKPHIEIIGDLPERKKFLDGTLPGPTGFMTPAAARTQKPGLHKPCTHHPIVRPTGPKIMAIPTLFNYLNFLSGRSPIISMWGFIMGALKMMGFGNQYLLLWAVKCTKGDLDHQARRPARHVAGKQTATKPEAKELPRPPTYLY